MGRNFQGLGHFTIAKHDDIVLRLFDDATLMKHLWRDFIVCRKMFFERFQANLEPLLLENIREAAFGQTTMQRHLAALETDLHRVAGTRLLSLFAATRRLAEPAAWTTPDALLFMGRALGWTQIVKTECHCLIQ